MILFPLFATIVVDTADKFAAGVVDTGGNMPTASLTPETKFPPVSTAPAVLVAKFATGVVDTGGKFAAGVVDLRMSPLISFEMTLMLFSGAYG
jgi:hypothetical protein